MIARGVTDVGLGSLAEGCSTLQSLHLNGCELVSNIGLGSLSQGCSNDTEVGSLWLQINN